MKYTKFTPANLDEFRKMFNETVKELSEKTGVHIQMGKQRYGDDEFTATCTFTIIAEGEDPKSAKDKKSLRDYGHYYNLSEEDYGKEIKLQNGASKVACKIVAVNPRATKMPIIVERIDGKGRYKIPQSVLERVQAES